MVVLVPDVDQVVANVAVEDCVDLAEAIPLQNTLTVVRFLTRTDLADPTDQCHRLTRTRITQHVAHAISSTVTHRQLGDSQQINSKKAGFQPSLFF